MELLSSETAIIKFVKIELLHRFIALAHLQLNDVEFSFFGYVVVTADVGVTVADVAADGVRNGLRGTDTQPFLSPSLARANSNINLPSAKYSGCFKYCLK